MPLFCWESRSISAENFLLLQELTVNPDSRGTSGVDYRLAPDFSSSFRVAARKSLYLWIFARRLRTHCLHSSVSSRLLLEVVSPKVSRLETETLATTFSAVALIGSKKFIFGLGFFFSENNCYIFFHSKAQTMGCHQIACRAHQFALRLFNSAFGYKCHNIIWYIKSNLPFQCLIEHASVSQIILQ